MTHYDQIIRIFFIISVFLMYSIHLAVGEENDQELSLDEATGSISEVEKARDAVYPALVNISVVSQNFTGGRAERSPGAGSGVIISPEGHVLTNYHVVADATQITCTRSDGEQFDAEILEHDPLTDISVLKLDIEDYEGPLQYAEIGRSADINVGDFVFAMGNPLTLSSSMSMGIVSNPQQVLTDFLGTEIQEMEFDEGEQTGFFTQWIQHDAPILPGNSGGPLVNIDGEVIGINARGVGIGTFGLAIPSDQANRVYQDVVAHGEVPRGWLGIRVLPVDKIGRETGSLVSWVLPESPADRMGLEPGDILLSVNNIETNARFFEEVPAIYRKIGEQTPNQQSEIRFLRNGNEEAVSIELDKMEPYVGEQFEVLPLGVTLRNITGPMALNYQLHTSEGVFVTGVRPGFPMEEASPRVRSDDVITHLDGDKVTSVEEFIDIVEELDEERTQLPVKLYRDAEEIITVLDIEESPDRPSAGELPNAWIGIERQVLTEEVAEAIDLEGETGFRITEIFEGTEAEASGLRKGDVIIAAGEHELDASRERDDHIFDRTIDRFNIGDQVNLTVLRNGNEETIEIELEATPDGPSQMRALEQEQFEFEVREASFLDYQDNNWHRDVEGLVVADVTSGGWANLGGLRVNDLVQTIQGQDVTDIDEFEKVMDEVLEEEPEVIRLFVHRGHRTHFVFIDPDWEQVLN